MKHAVIMWWTRNESAINVGHYGDVIMGAIASQITSLTIVHSTVYSDADQIKHQSSASLAFVREFTGTGEFPAQMASNAENVSIWWRHNVDGRVFGRYNWMWHENINRATDIETHGIHYNSNIVKAPYQLPKSHVYLFLHNIAIYMYTIPVRSIIIIYHCVELTWGSVVWYMLALLCGTIILVLIPIQPSVTLFSLEVLKLKYLITYFYRCHVPHVLLVYNFL